MSLQQLMRMYGADNIGAYQMSPDDQFQPVDFGGQYTQNPAFGGQGNALAQMMGLNGDRGTVSTIPSTYAKDSQDLDTMFQGAIAGGDIDKAARLATTPQQRALLDSAYGQFANEREQRGKQAQADEQRNSLRDMLSQQAFTMSNSSDPRERMQGAQMLQSTSGLIQNPAPVQGNMVQDYRNLQETQLGRNRAEEDRKLKIEQMRGQMARTDAETTNLLLKPVQPTTAPTMTEVLDPKDPSRLLRVDARAYKGGTLGAPGVLGVSGKEPTSAKREETANSGRDGLAADIQLIRDNYAKLADSKAIPSTENGPGTNLMARVQSSGIGQATGGTFGTQEQAARNEIQAAKRRLLSSIKNITGASSQEMNSNVELKTWMDSLGDSSGILESNLGILDAIEKKYLKSKDYKATGAPTAQGQHPSDIQGLLSKYGK